MEFYILASGSKGNATIVKNNNNLLLIDMGITLTRLREELNSINQKIEDIGAVLFTHEHSDHASGARFFEEELIFATKGTLKNLKHNVLLPYKKTSILGFEVTPLLISHDANMPVGFMIEANNQKLVYMTDTGAISEKNLKLMKNATYYIIESNHNIKMLLQTNRPADLKHRILSDVGHLSNEDSALYMSEVIGEETKEIILAHLSEEANDPELAINTYERIFRKKLINLKNVRLHYAKQWSMTKGGRAYEN
ncbi:MAG: MBL fold metallo-hydrolase [Bacilli bacterium]|jgi:phosphoribosyl 1,2-cyclic phosphodiesterase|nr:MBL fold metallo-hydrolase [Bacilli bacterium]